MKSCRIWKIIAAVRRGWGRYADTGRVGEGARSGERGADRGEWGEGGI